jgi:hypothetical protein
MAYAFFRRNDISENVESNCTADVTDAKAIVIDFILVKPV